MLYWQVRDLDRISAAIDSALTRGHLVGDDGRVIVPGAERLTELVMEACRAEIEAIIADRTTQVYDPAGTCRHAGVKLY